MKKLAGLLAVLMLVLCALTLVGCNGEDNGTSKYVIFTDNYGKEYKLTTSGTKEFSVYYDEDKTYSFTYQVYYTKTDVATIESGSFAYTAQEVKDYTFTAKVYLKDKGHQDYTLKLKILPAPDLRIVPEIVFLAKEYSFEFKDGKYVYQYDGNGFKYPDFQVLAEGGGST